LAPDLADKAAVAHVRANVNADSDNVIGCSDLRTRSKAQGSVAGAGGVARERTITDGRVGVADGVG
jgi:hypothetical protein